MKKLSTLLLLSVILFGCGDYGEYGPEIIEEEGDIVPLEIGNYWTFQDSIFDDEGQFTHTSTAKVAISGMSTLDYEGTSKNMYYWNWNTMPESEPWLFWLLCGIEDDGHHYYGGMTSTDTTLLENSLNYKYPVSVGESWDYYSIISSGSDEYGYTFEIRDTILVSCIGKGEELVTPAGKFSCYIYEGKYEDDGKAYVKKNYLSPGHGYIAYDNYTDGVLRFRRTLIETNL